MEISDLPIATRRKLPQYPLPVLRLARLAVDETAQRQGIGVALLRFALRLALAMANDYGCVGVVVDAKPDAVAFYARYGFVAVGRRGRIGRPPGAHADVPLPSCDQGGEPDEGLNRT